MYGFDTAHEVPRNDPAWILSELEALLLGVEEAAKVEAAYLATTDQEERKKYALRVAGVRPAAPGFMAMVNLLAGEI